MKPDKSPVKVLVAEDNDSNYLLMETILKGYDLTHVCITSRCRSKIRHRISEKQESGV